MRNSRLTAKPLGVTNTGLVHLRTFAPMTRRGFAKGALAAGTLAAGALAAGAAAVGLAGREARAAEGVNYFGWQGYDLVPNAGGFMDQNGLYLETTYISTNEEILAAARAAGKGQMDLVTPMHCFIPLYNQGGLLEPLDLSRIPNIQGLFPEFQNVPELMKDGQLYALPFAWGALQLMYNADVIAEPPTAWEDLFKPEYKGKASAVLDVFGVMVPFAAMATGRKAPTRLTQAELDKTVDLLIAFKKEHALTFATYGDLAGLFATGEAIIGIASEAVSVWAGPDAPTLKWVMPELGGNAFLDCWAMIADSPHRDRNYEILNQILSPEAQALDAELNAQGVVVEAAVALLKDTERALYPYDDIGSFFERAGGLTPMYPLEPEGDFVTYDQVLDGWDKFLSA